jgi:hypothetical protein
VGVGLDPVDAVAVMDDVAGGRERVNAAVDTTQEWAPDDADDDGLWRAELVKRFGMVRGFLELLAEAIPLAPAAQPDGRSWPPCASCPASWAARRSARLRSARSW